MGGAGGCGGWTHGDRAPLAGENKLGGGREMFVPVPLSALTYWRLLHCCIAGEYGTTQVPLWAGSFLSDLDLVLHQDWYLL